VIYTVAGLINCTPLVAPQVSHLRQVPLRIREKLPHSSQNALAAKLGKGEKEVRRLLDPEHVSRICSTEAALHALGKRIQVVIEDAE
jgi:antitoxin HicB